MSFLLYQAKYIFVLAINYNLGQRFADKFTKLSKTGFPLECFKADFLQFFTKKQRQNLAFMWPAEHTPLNLSISRIFLISLKFLKLFGNSLDNSYIHFLVITILFRFTCGEKKLCLKVKKSAITLSKIVLIARQSGAISEIFSLLLMLSHYFTHLKSYKINWKI